MKTRRTVLALAFAAIGSIARGATSVVARRDSGGIGGRRGSGAVSYTVDWGEDCSWKITAETNGSPKACVTSQYSMLIDMRGRWRNLATSCGPQVEESKVSGDNCGETEVQFRLCKTNSKGDILGGCLYSIIEKRDR